MSKTVFSLKILLAFAILNTAFLLSGSAAATSHPRIYNERATLRAMRTLHGAQMTYASTSGNGNFASLASLHTVSLIQAALASGDTHGYLFNVSFTPRTVGSPATFTITATPRVYGRTGRISFFVDTPGEIRGRDRNGQPATVADPVIDDCTTGVVSGNESCIIQDLRTLHGAQMTYAATVGNRNYGSLSELGNASLINASQASGRLRGYTISVVTFPRTTGSPERFYVFALPQTYGVSGVRSFFIGTEGVIYGADKQGMPANENDPPLNE